MSVEYMLASGVQGVVGHHAGGPGGLYKLRHASYSARGYEATGCVRLLLWRVWTMLRQIDSVDKEGSLKNSCSQIFQEIDLLFF